MLELILKAVGALAMIAGILIVVSVLYAWPVMLLWDWLMPSLFRLRTITLLEAWGLVVLCGLLLKSGSSSEK
jgi:hypothetical protein